MRSEAGGFRASDGRTLHLRAWLPENPPRAVVQIAHGMGEHGARYDRLGAALAAARYAVYAHDQRGHGLTALSEDELGDLGPDGWNRAVRDLVELNAHLRERHPEAPRVLLGHSMGSFMLQQYLLDHGGTLAAAVLSGSSSGAGLTMRIAAWVTRAERWRLGPTAQSALVGRLVFGRFNREFAPARTDFDWLSRDPEEVDRYVLDPRCGFMLRTQSLLEMYWGLRRTTRRAELARIPKDLPIHVFSGECDPVHAKGRGFRRLLRGYEALGLRRLSHKLYADGRHEMFNERNRDEVIADLLAWLEKHVG